MPPTKTSGGFRFNRPAHYKSKDPQVISRPVQESPPLGTVQICTPAITQNASKIVQTGLTKALPRSPESDRQDSPSSIHLESNVPLQANHDMPTYQTTAPAPIKAPTLVPDQAIVISPNQMWMKIPFDIDYETFEQEMHELMQPDDEEAIINGFVYRINGASEHRLKEHLHHKFLQRMAEAKMFGQVRVQVRLPDPVFKPHSHNRKLTYI